MPNVDQKQTVIGVFLSVVTTVAAAGIITLVTITYGMWDAFNTFKIEQAYWQGTVDARLQNLTEKVDGHMQEHSQGGGK